MVEVGDLVNYVPSTDYWLDTDAGNDLIFELYHKRPQGKDQPRVPYTGPRKGEKMPPATHLEPGKPLNHWKAKVTVVYDENTVDLEIYHPKGHILLHQKVAQGTEMNNWYPMKPKAEKHSTATEHKKK